jgi:hypothetical protein
VAYPTVYCVHTDTFIVPDAKSNNMEVGSRGCCSLQEKFSSPGAYKTNSVKMHNSPVCSNGSTT